MASGAKTTQSRIARSTRSSQPHRRRHRVLRFSPGVFFGCFLPALPSGEMGIFCSKSQDHHTDLDALGTIQEINPGENAFAGCARIRGHEVRAVAGTLLSMSFLFVDFTSCTFTGFLLAKRAFFLRNAVQFLMQFLKENYSVLGWRLLSDEPHPLVYAQDYNITFFGLEKIHPFDSCKVCVIDRCKAVSDLTFPVPLPTWRSASGYMMPSPRRLWWFTEFFPWTCFSRSALHAVQARPR